MNNRDTLETMTRNIVLREALQLPPDERADVAAELLASLEEEPREGSESVEKAWAAEIERRGRRVLAGRSEGLPWEEVRERVARRLAEQ